MTHTPAGYEGNDDLVHSDTKVDVTVEEAANLPGGYKTTEQYKKLMARQAKFESDHPDVGPVVVD